MLRQSLIYLYVWAKLIETLDRRIKIFINYFLGPVLFVILSISIYRNITSQKDWQQSLVEIRKSVQGEQGWKAILVVLLMFLNWSFEAMKWRVLLRHIQQISFFKAFRAVLSGLGVSVAMNTPNGAGEYVGRIMYVKEGNRLRAITLTLVGSISQQIVTMLMGTIGLFLLHHRIISALYNTIKLPPLVLDALTYIGVALTTLLLVIYFEIGVLIKMLEKIPFVRRYAYFIQKLEELNWKELLKVLLIAGLRYSVFAIQYLLLLQVFNVGIDTATSFWCVTVMFLVLAIVPSFTFAEIGVRGFVSLQLFGVFSTNVVGITFTAIAIWFINIIVPALAGSLFLLGIKLFRNK